MQSLRQIYKTPRTSAPTRLPLVQLNHPHILCMCMNRQNIPTVYHKRPFAHQHLPGLHIQGHDLFSVEKKC